MLRGGEGRPAPERFNANVRTVATPKTGAQVPEPAAGVEDMTRRPFGACRDGH